VELLRGAALAAAAAWPADWIPYPPWSARPDFFLRVTEDLEEWRRDAEAFEEAARKCGIRFRRPEPAPPPVDGEAAKRALMSLYALLLTRLELSGGAAPPDVVLPRVANAFAHCENVILVDALRE
jgi:hypothetical protein